MVAEVVAERLAVDVKWTNRFAETKSMCLHDVLIVAPYNAQVSEISRRLPGLGSAP